MVCIIAGNEGKEINLDFFVYFHFYFYQVPINVLHHHRPVVVFFIANKIFHFKKTMYNFCRRKLLKVNNFDVNEVFMERHLNFHISISL